MRGFALGLLLLVIFVVTILSARPGGLRRQLRFAARRLKVALVLAGIYMVVSAVLRLAFPSSSLAEWALVGLAVVLSGAFLVLAQDPPATDQRDRT